MSSLLMRVTTAVLKPNMGINILLKSVKLRVKDFSTVPTPFSPPHPFPSLSLAHLHLYHKCVHLFITFHHRQLINTCMQYILCKLTTFKTGRTGNVYIEKVYVL